MVTCHFPLIFSSLTLFTESSKLHYLISLLIRPLNGLLLNRPHIMTFFFTFPSSNTESLPRCQGCSNRIFDPFVLKLGHENERHTCWHASKCTFARPPVRTFQFFSPCLSSSWRNMNNNHHQMSDCLVCFDCQSSLTVKCYLRDGKPFCKDDFYKRFAKTKCANCDQGKKNHLPRFPNWTKISFPFRNRTNSHC